MSLKRWLTYLTCLLLLTPQPALGATHPPEPPPPADTGPWVVRAYYPSLTALRELTSRREVWEVHPDAGYVVLDVTAAEATRLRALGFRLETDAKLTAQLRHPPVAQPGQTHGIPGYPCYRTVEETYETAQQLAAAHPDLATWIDIGDSWERTAYGDNAGYDLMILRLTNTAIPGPKPGLFVMASMHAREYTPAELNTRFAAYLLDNYGTDPDVTWLLDYHEIHLLLQANPDGRKHAEAGQLWRKNTNENYCSPTSNYRGADLNRNYEFRWGCCGGSSTDPCDETYRGPSPASEPETQAVEAYLRAHFPDQRDDDLSAAAPLTATGIFLDLHSYSQLVLWPWGFTSTPAPNGTALQTLGRKFAYFNGYHPQQAMELYPTDGTTDDFAYGDLGLAAYTFELGTSFFQDCATFEATILPDNLRALIYAAKVARTPYLTPAGPDALDLTLSTTAPLRGATVVLTATLDDTRYSNANGTEPTQPIAAAIYTVDVPPWDDAAIAHPTPPVDGAFNTPVETVTATIATADLSPGRHLIFVRGQDSAGNWGAVSAVFLYVLDPATAPTVEGYVRDATTHAPLAATITAGPVTSRSDPATGHYTLRILSGTHTLTLSADGYSSLTQSLTLTNRQTLRLTHYLTPTCAILADDVEGGNIGWNAEGQWAITGEAYHTPTHAWTDSPGTDYGNNWDYALTSSPLNLSDDDTITLDFWHTYTLEEGWDFGYVEYSVDGGSSWQQLATYTGSSNGWEAVHFDLSALAHQPDVRLRFRLTTDSNTTRDGWYIDDIILRGGSLACGPAPFAPTADFTATAPRRSGIPLRFDDLSQGTPPLTTTWDFGDGTPPTTTDFPTHTYTIPGLYTVTLAVTNALGSDLLRRPIYILPAEPAQVAWTAQLYHHGTLTNTLPLAIEAGDLLTLVEQISVTYALPADFTLHVTRTASLTPTGWMTTIGHLTATPTALHWSAQDAPTATWHTFTHTYRVLPGTWTTDILTFTLWAADAAVPPTTRTIPMRHHHPDIAIAPDTLALTLSPGSTTTRTIILRNAGTANLRWTAILTPSRPWLDLAPPTDGTLLPATRRPLTLTFTAPITDALITTTAILLISDDPDEATLTIPITLTTCTPPLHATITFTPTTPQAGHPVTLTGHITQGTPPLTFTWQLGDETTATGISVTHTYPISHTYPVTLTVANACGYTATTYPLTVTGEPRFVITPTAVNLTLPRGLTATETLYLHNTGTANLHWTLEEAPPVPWLHAAPVEGTLTPQRTGEITLALAASGPAFRPYTTTLRLRSDAPAQPALTLPVTLTVTCAPVLTATLRPPIAAISTGTPITFEAAALPLTATQPITYRWEIGGAAAREEEHIGGLTDTFTISWTAEGTYTLTVGVQNCGGAATATLTLTVTAPRPHLRIAPPPAVTLRPQGRTTRAMTLTNQGDAPLTWTLDLLPSAAWLMPAATAGKVPPASTRTLTLTFDARTLDAGRYTATLRLTSNDLARPVITLPVTLTVTAKPITAVAVSLVSPPPLYPRRPLTLRVDIRPQDAARPFTYTINGGPERTAVDNPIILTRTYAITGRQTLTIGVRNPETPHPVTAAITFEIVPPPPCVPLAEIALTLIDGTLQLGTPLTLRADLIPDDATKPYTYTVDYGEGEDFGPPTPATADPLYLTHTFRRFGNLTVTLAAWNCAAPITATLPLTLPAPYDIYLPLVLRGP